MRISILALLFLIFLSVSFACAESITLSTYYPAPQGSYNNMKIKNTWCAGTPCFTLASNDYNATFTLYGDATIHKDATIHGKTTLKGEVSFEAPITFQKPVTFNGQAKFKNNIEVINTITVNSGNTTNTALTATGRVYANAFFHNSDQRLKENIVPIGHALDKILSLEGVYYYWKDNPDQRKIGLIAQKVESILPEVVVTNEQGFKSVAYAEIIGLLIEAIKEQQIQIDALKKQLNYEK